MAARTPWSQWPRLPVYLKAMTLRMDKYNSNPARDQAREADIQELEQMWREKWNRWKNKTNPSMTDRRTARIIVYAGVEDTVSGVGEAVIEGVGRVNIKWIKLFL